MSGDVQPRKRKDKKRKKDELSLEEHRGTAATFGEGDVQMHSQHDHGTGGHWCAKIIFFSLLAVLVTLIGLIILENRGLTELEANSVESQYSGILNGWIEDAPDDDHHDEHTLELKHHEHNEDIDEHGPENDEEIGDDDDDNEDDDEHGEEFDHDGNDDEEEGDGDDEDGDDDEIDEAQDENESKEIDDDEEIQEDEDSQGNDDDSNDEEENENEELDIQTTENRFTRHDDDDDGDDDDDDNDDDDGTNYDTDQVEGNGDLENDDIDLAEDDDDDGEDNADDISNEIANNGDKGSNAESVENYDDEDDSKEEQDDEDDEEHEEDHDEDAEEEIEKIEKEVLDQDEPESAEPPLPDVSDEKEEEVSVEDVNHQEEYEEEDRPFLEVDDLDEPAVERIAPPPAGKPYVEIEDEVSSETTPDSLAEEEEYEKQQEELRQQEAQSTQMWLKLAVGGALLAATHAVIRRATAPRDTPENEQDEHASREETPLTDRRMTLISEETPNVIPPQSFQQKIEEQIVQKVSPVVKAAAVVKQDSEEVDEDVELDEEVVEDEEIQVKKNVDKNKELYSDDEDENEADEEVDDEEEIEEKKEPPKPILKVPPVEKKQAKPEPEDVPDDVEIIDDEQIEEEVEEEVEDEEEISDVDDAELLSRLEAKYGRLPEPERPGQKHKDGGNSLEDDWPGEPSDPFWREQLEKAEQELRQGTFVACEERVSAAQLASSGRGRWLRARALDQLAEARRDNRVLARAITAYKQLLEMNERLSDKKLLEVALRTIDRIQFRGTYLNAEPVYRLLIRRFPNDVTYRNNLTISFLMANRADLASEVLQETLRLWPKDRVALAHYGFVLKTEQNKVEEAVIYFQKALEGDTGPANEPRFYYHLGDALLMLGRSDEAHEVHKRGAALGHFLSPSQRSLYNVPRLKSQPWWDVKTTPYAQLARELEKSWREILKEGEAAQSLYEKEKEGLRERGEWSQLDLFVRGKEVPGRCARAPVTCRIVNMEPAAQCRRGQVKFSLLSGGTHVRAHVGPTNCRLRMHLALSNTDRTYIRVDQEIRQWQVGKVLMFDDSFEHEVWHNGTNSRLVLIVDVWHPALTQRERIALPAI